ncbi:BTB domain-containing protein [Nephila pilipes]|uniref:BTB domain-containing protein n=1 Tax=Nephila pilipes TaxID=299642 RepID=A0A8X6NJZ4_NEPPI|nr:BTB domain-containing protein [Nephila pilipes]
MFPILSNRSRCSSVSTTSSQHPGASSRHARLLRQFNEDIFKRHVLTDVDLVVEGKVFKCHRAVLVCFSPALKRKLLGPDGKPITKKVLESRNDIRTYFYIYAIAKKMDVQENWLRALKLLTHRFEEAICAPEFLQLDVNCVMELLSAQSIGARSEVLVFLAALNWLNHDYENRQDYAVKVMECVRFSSMTMDEIVACYHPPFLPQLLDKPEIVMHLFRATCYITAKFLGQQAWFKHFGRQKRNLAFENLPMELWHQKGPPTISNMDFALHWKKSMEFELPPNRLDIVQLDNSGNHFPNGYNADMERTKLEQGYGTHQKDSFPQGSNEFQYFGTLQQKHHSPSKSPDRNSKTHCYSTTNLTVAVKKVFQECARTPANEASVTEVVKKVLKEINSDEKKGKHADDKVLDAYSKAEYLEAKKEMTDSCSRPSHQSLPFKAQSSFNDTEKRKFHDKKSPDTRKAIRSFLRDGKEHMAPSLSSEKKRPYKDKKNSFGYPNQEAEPFELPRTNKIPSGEFKEPSMDSNTTACTNEEHDQFTEVRKITHISPKHHHDETANKFLSPKLPKRKAKLFEISERLPGKATFTTGSSVDIQEEVS